MSETTDRSTDRTERATTQALLGSMMGDLASLPTRVLVQGMAHQDGTIVSAEVLPVADACGQTREQVRSCLRRLVNEGLYVREGEGRESVFRATEAGLASMGTQLDRHRLAFAQDAAGRGWDRSWHLVAFAIPETKRAARDGLRDQLRSLGGALLQNGIYVSPHGWEPQVRAAAQRLGVDEHLTTATTEDLQVGGERDPRELARRLWNIDELAQRYGQFVESYEDVPERLEDMRSHRERLTDADFQPGALWIGVQFGECFQNDPLLPPELLPRPWPGRKARDVLARCRRLGMLIREENQAPPLFQMWDDVIRALP
ncbi:MAG: PaaX family transcriptional regulator C-terminal domain-containing protein [Acidimicrobiales bacterium]